MSDTGDLTLTLPLAEIEELLRLLTCEMERWSTDRETFNALVQLRAKIARQLR